MDFYSLSDRLRKHKLFSISEKEFELLDDVWSQYKKLTGVYIDAYGTTRIYPEHVTLIKKLLLNHSDKAAKKLLSYLDKSNEGYLLLGD